MAARVFEFDGSEGMQAYGQSNKQQKKVLLSDFQHEKQAYKLQRLRNADNQLQPCRKEY